MGADLDAGMGAGMGADLGASDARCRAVVFVISTMPAVNIALIRITRAATIFASSPPVIAGLLWGAV
ncbi:hypothetical protein DA075_05405 [Methylobacterium currus]|uniref:Uncharacterized protein n=1 Tax=Methylobacterium currus TaxID=2051553 RepID=A0A2R4WFY9_9HYPH|nr:hypothetical protein DA075_05405 [Methylobacterium currus]